MPQIRFVLGLPDHSCCATETRAHSASCAGSPEISRYRCSSWGLSICPSLCNDRRRGAASASKLWSPTVAVLWRLERRRWERGGTRFAAAFKPGAGAHHTGDELNWSQRLSCMHRHVVVDIHALVVNVLQPNNQTTKKPNNDHFGSSRGHSWPGLSQWPPSFHLTIGSNSFFFWLMGTHPVWAWVCLSFTSDDVAASLGTRLRKWRRSLRCGGTISCRAATMPLLLARTVSPVPQITESIGDGVQHVTSGK